MALPEIITVEDLFSSPTRAVPQSRRTEPDSLSGSVEGTGSPSKFIVIQENFVDQQVVKQGLLYGLTQGQLAKGLGMSKRDVNRLARFPYIACRSI